MCAATQKPQDDPASNRVERRNGIALEVFFHPGPHLAMEVSLNPLLLQRLIFKGDTQDIIAIIAWAQKLYVAKTGLRGYRRLERTRKHLLRRRGLPSLHFDFDEQNEHDQVLR